MSNIGVIGWGVVGRATGEGFATSPENKIFWYDKFNKKSAPLSQVITKSQFIFLCLPTPMFDDDSGIDLSIMDEMVAKIAPKIAGTNKILIIKSTVVPGTTVRYAQKYPKVNFAMNPEFLTEINAPWDFLHPDRVIIGAINEDIGWQIARLYRPLLGYEVKIFVTDPTTAEMAKYMANTFFMTKIIFANEMHTLCEKLNINYDDVKKMVAADKRITESFLGVTPFRGFGCKCFPKDMIALLGRAKELNVDLSLLKAVWKKNLKIRKIKDWHAIHGAVSVKNKKHAKTS
jgi:UDPglucose 6-dehydrogenase